MRADNPNADGVPPNLRGLRAYVEAHDCAGVVAKAVETFPVEERFALADQMRRAACSVYANIAEGHGRASRGDQRRFYDYAWSSLSELQAHTEHAVDRKMLSASAAKDIRQRSYGVSRLLAGLRRAIDRDR
jgi:four helix bundle protein